VVEYLFQQNEISKATFRKGSHLKILDLNGAQGVEADLLDHQSLHEAAEGTDTIFSMASPMPGDGEDFEGVNNRGLRNLVEVAQEMRVKTVVHLSTIDVYGFGKGEVSSESVPSPGDDYQRAKLDGERILTDFASRSPQPRIVLVRAARAVGSRDESLVIPLLRMIKKGRVTVPRGSVMSFTHPKDIAQAMYKASVNPVNTGGTFLVKSFDAEVGALVGSLSRAVGADAEVRKAGVFSRTELPEYATRQLNASLRFAPQTNWDSLGYAPAFDLQSTCMEIAQWYKRESWVTESS
jgi:nucleoside-diphosphate-sugar epimerase